MCVSKGAPSHPKAQTERQKGMQEAFDLLQSNNAVYVADPDFNTVLEDFKKKNKIKSKKATKTQEKYVKAVEKAMPSLVS